MNLTRKVFNHPYYFIAFGFGSGLAKKAPGTFGTLMALPLYYFLSQTPHLVYLSITIVSFIFGVYISQIISNELGVDDYSGIVWDEIVGMWLTLFLVPVNLLWIGLGFILFRFFDILKPPPIRWVDKRVKSGLGVMLDDVIAAGFAWIILQLLIWIAS